MKNKIKIILSFVIFFSGFLMWQNAQAATIHYVSLSGNDTAGNGSSGSPWRTITYCNAHMGVGDTCSVADGNYDEFVNITVGGSDGSHHGYLISPNKHAVVRNLFFGASYVTADGFEVTQPNGDNGYPAVTFNRQGVGVGITDAIVQNCYIHDTLWSQKAISYNLSPYPTYVTINNNIIENVDGPNMMVGGSHWLIENNTFRHNRSDVAYYDGDNHTIQDNTFIFQSEGDEGHHADFMQNMAGGSDHVTNLLFQRNKYMYGALVQIGNFNNDTNCAANGFIFRNNIFYGITNPFNYAGCNTEFENNTFAFAAMSVYGGAINYSSGSNGVGVTTNIDFQNNSLIACNGEDGAPHGGSFDTTFSTLTNGHNMVADWPNTGFASRTNFNTTNGNINGGDPKFTNLPISVYPIELPGGMFWNMEGATSAANLQNAWLVGNGNPIPLNGGVFYNTGNPPANWTFNSPWAYHTGADWTQYYASHSSNGTSTLVYTGWAPTIGKRYSIQVRGANDTIAAGSITPSLGGQTGTTCNSANLVNGGWCPTSYIVATTTDPFTVTPSSDFRDGVFQVMVTWVPDTSTYDLSTSIKHSGTQSLHLMGLVSGDYVYTPTSSQFPPSFMTLSGWVYLVSGSVQMYVKDGVGTQVIDSTSTTGSWIHLSGDVTINDNANVYFQATSNNTEFYLDDVTATLKYMTTNTIQYPYNQAADITVGSNISINGDGVCRAVLSKDATNHYVTFSPALSSPPPYWATWIEAWGSKNNCTLDLTLQSSSPARNTGANLSASFTDDISGDTRTTWDIGAYGYASGSPDTTPPAAPSGLAVN